MFIQTELGLCIEDVQIGGHAQTITLRSYRPAVKRSAVPVILYFHGGLFTSGTLDDGDVVASLIARSAPAWVLSVGYSLAPRFPFPHATEDGYRALLWAVAQARAQRADPRRIGLAGHDAGGNLATCVAAIARDRTEVKIGAQALIAPLLDPSMTRLGDESGMDTGFDVGACARGYAEYLPGLIAAGVPTQMTRYGETSRQDIVRHEATLLDLVSFFRKRLGGARPLRSGSRSGAQLEGT